MLTDAEGVETEKAEEEVAEEEAADTESLEAVLPETERLVAEVCKWMLLKPKPLRPR